MDPSSPFRALRFVRSLLASWELAVGRVAFMLLIVGSSVLLLARCGGDGSDDAATEVDGGAGGTTGDGGFGGGTPPLDAATGGQAGDGGKTDGGGPPPPLPGDGFVPLHPYRGIDTRGSALPAKGVPRCLEIAGLGGVPSSAKAVLINLTAVGPTGPGSLVAYAEGGTAPETSTLNFASGRTVANGAIVSLGKNGSICVMPRVSATHFVVDISGFFAASSGYGALTPSRILDTRGGAKPAAGSTTCLAVAGVAGVPATAKAVAVNVTVVAPDAPGFLRAHPAGQNVAATSTMNFQPGQTIASGAVVAIGSGGQVCVTLGPSAAHVIVDLNAYFDENTRFHALVPTRKLNTTSGTQPKAGSTTCIDVTDGTLPASARGVVLNLVAVKPAESGFLVVYPDGHGKPSTSSVNYFAGETIANNAIIQPGDGGRICVYSLKATDIILDVTGYFEAAASGDPCAALNCVNPPPKVCSGGQSLVTYAANGVCKHGTCIYTDSASACPDACSVNSCTPTYGWDYNLRHRCIKSVAPGQTNYYQDTTDCPVPARNWTVAVQSEKSLQSSCSGVANQSLPVNAGGPLTLAWVPHVDELGRANQQVILKSDFVNFAHPCGAGTYTWYTIMDHKYHGGGPSFPNAAETTFHANIYYDDWAPNGGSRLIAAYNGEWDGQGVMVEIDLQHVNWGDAYPNLPEIVQKKVNASPPFQWVELDGAALGLTVPRKQDTPITVAWHSIIANLIAQGHLTGPSGGLAKGVTTALNVATEVRNGGSGKNTVSAEVRVSDFRIGKK